MSEHADPPLSGRRAQAARNDRRILESARAVFVADPGAPITAVAHHAGVGISALYSRYPSKEELLRTLCMDGLERFIEITEDALADERAPWAVFSTFMERAVDADTNSLTIALAGTFTPTEDMFVRADHANDLGNALFERVRGALRPDVEVHDLSLIFEQLAAIKTGGPERQAELRRRYLALMLDGLRATNGEVLPGPAPTWQEITARWTA